MSRLCRSTLAAVLLLPPWAMPGPARAAWPHDPNVNVPICTSKVYHQNLASCSDGAGGAIMVWAESRTGNYDIYAQRVDRNGVVLWTQDGVAVCGQTSMQLNPVLCPDDHGGAIVAWYDTRGASGDIYAQSIDASGVPQWTLDGLPVCTAASTQSAATICRDGAGGAIIAWSDGRNGGRDIFVQRLSQKGAPQWTADGVALCTSAGNQEDPRIVLSGAGAAIVGWMDRRAGNDDVYARRVSSAGSAQWTVDGNPVCTDAAAQSGLEMVEDGSGGVILAWRDDRAGGGIFAQRLDVSGGEQWDANGIPVSTTSFQDHARLIPDGAGGAIIAWADMRSGDDDIYVQRLSAVGGHLWGATGVALCTATAFQTYPYIVSDAAGGAVVVWTDVRTGADDVYAGRVTGSGSVLWQSDGVAVCTNRINMTEMAAVGDGQGGVVASWGGYHDGDDGIYAQRVDRFAELGSPEPTITRIRDVAADEGGHVVLEWTASYLDADPGFAIAGYSIWRQAPSSLAQARSLAADAAPSGIGGRTLRATAEGVQTVYWECVGSQPARGRPGYSFVATTTTDSMPGSNRLTRFLVSAEKEGGVPFWDSAADSGYSVDNLAPPMPAPFTGQYAGGACTLQWGASPAADFAEFRLHRGLTAGFVPGPGNLVTATTSGGHVDESGAPYVYKLCAVDVHGNVSAWAYVEPDGIVDVPGAAAPRELSLSAPAPNPARGTTTLRLSLPRAAQVTLAIFDQQGRRMRALLSGVQPAGVHPLVWDGRDDGGRRVPSGIYFVRCDVEGSTFTRRIATLQ